VCAGDHPLLDQDAGGASCPPVEYSYDAVARCINTLDHLAGRHRPDTTSSDVGREAGAQGPAGGTRATTTVAIPVRRA
jgi:hypothetical protein